MAPRKKQDLSQDEQDYQELGTVLAYPVAIGAREMAWALDLGDALGHRPAQVKAWIERYRTENADELERLNTSRGRLAERQAQIRDMIREGVLARKGH